MSEPIYGFLHGLLPGLKNPVVIELGAHVGDDTEWICNHLRQPFTYVAVEPDPRNFVVLKNRMINAARGDVRLYETAVGAEDGVQTFYLSGGRREEHDENYVHTDSSSIKRPDGILQRYPWMQFTESHVAVYQLDTITKIERLRRVDLIWADVQGAELDLVRGAQETLARTRFFYTECYARTYLYRGQPTLEQIERELPGDDWHVIFRTQTDVLFENRKPKR